MNFITVYIILLEFALWEFHYNLVFKLLLKLSHMEQENTWNSFKRAVYLNGR